MEEIGKKYSEVIQDSIHSIVCIDDHYVDVYDDIKRIQELEEDYIGTQNMYGALAANASSQVSLIRYDKKKDISSILQNRDLLILDWKLYDDKDRTEETLQIIDVAVQADIPYVCIYTKDKIDDIFPMCARFFSGTTDDELKKNYSISDMLTKSTIKMVEDSKFFTSTDITEDFRNQVKEDLEQQGIVIEEKDFYNIFLARKIVPVKGKYWVSKNQVSICDIRKKVLCVKDTVILFMHKEDITADQVLDKIADAVKEVVENTVVNIIWLNYSNQFKRALRKRNSFLQNVKPEAFAYCVKKLSNNESDLETFVRELYRQELDDLVMAYDIEVPSELRDSLFSKIDNINRSDLVEQLIVINSRIMSNHVLSKIGHDLQLGDMFYSENEGVKDYWLCITALCDCARPQTNIDNDYLFVRGYLVADGKDIKNAVREAESKYDSYVEVDNRVIIIRWDKPIKSLCINNRVVMENNTIEGKFRDRTIVLKYIGTLKEKYVQRIANTTFSNAERVGVTLANTRQIEGRVKGIEADIVTIQIGPGEFKSVKYEDIDEEGGSIGINKKVYWDSFGWSTKSS